MATTYKFKKRTKISELENEILPESDLLFETETELIQMEAIEDIKDKKIKITPGSFMLSRSCGDMELKPFELKKTNLLAIDNTITLLKEANALFDRLDLYEELETDKKRGVLCYSRPGQGKSVTIENFCCEMLKKDKGTVIVFYPSSKVSAEDVHEFFALDSEYTAECTKLIIVIEDIGGIASDHVEKGATAGLLNFLAGSGDVFKLPTFFVATTNHPHTLLESLIRPGRFDLVMEFKKLTAKERLELLSFFAKRPLTEEEKVIISKKEIEDLSIAHLKEIVIRSRLHDKTYAEVVKELLLHNKKVKRQFTTTTNVGMLDDDFN